MAASMEWRGDVLDPLPPAMPASGEAGGDTNTPYVSLIAQTAFGSLRSNVRSQPPSVAEPEAVPEVPEPPEPVEDPVPALTPVLAPDEEPEPLPAAEPEPDPALTPLEPLDCCT
jgi:hypothetical protein